MTGDKQHGGEDAADTLSAVRMAPCGILGYTAVAPLDETQARSRVATVGFAFDGNGIIPCIVQQEGTGEVLMMAWMSEESIVLTLSTRTTWFWSRSRQELWNKGATSGNVQVLRELRYDCDGDCLLAIVDSPGPACHTGARSCFYRTLG